MGFVKVGKEEAVIVKAQMRAWTRELAVCIVRKGLILQMLCRMEWQALDTD